MIEWNSARPQLDYEVKVGHTAVWVRAGSRDDAIKQARLKLSQDMPRLWDVIHGLAESRFDVVCRGES